ncbi:hypothetical protein Tco_0231025 [Tanacetum coccineum]
MEMDLHLEEKFYPHLLTTISSCRWLLTHGIELAITKFLNSPEYLFALGAAIGKAIEKGMQDGLSAGITHGREGRVLMDVAAHNPSTEVDYIASLQRLQDVNFPLLGELKSSKDASIEVVMNILHLEEPLTDKLGLVELQPNYPVLTGTEGTSDVVPATSDTTTSLSTTFASTSIIALISVDDYEVYFSILALLFTSRITACSLCSSKRLRLISKASLFYTKSTSAVLSVGMAISAGMTASVSYVNENGVSSLLDFIMNDHGEVIGVNFCCGFLGTGL